LAAVAINPNPLDLAVFRQQADIVDPLPIPLLGFGGYHPASSAAGLFHRLIQGESTSGKDLPCRENSKQQQAVKD
jgi:hypothetical protein